MFAVSKVINILVEERKTGSFMITLSGKNHNPQYLEFANIKISFLIIAVMKNGFKIN